MRNIKPSFDGQEPTVKIFIGWNDRKRQKIHSKLVTEITLYNEQEYKDLIDGIHRAVNNIRQART